MLSPDEVQSFEEARPRLLGIAYRFLSSMADAEDALQDTFVKWANTDRQQIDDASSWLTTVCTRRCIDMLRAAHRSRVNYVGAWLPEPIQTRVEDHTGSAIDLASSLTTGFLLLLDRLTPKERAAYLLHEIFEISYPVIAEMLDLREATCRKLVSRAKSNVDQAKVRHKTPPERQSELLNAFQDAITSGSTSQLAGLLSSDIQLTADGGGKVPTIFDILNGKAEVLEFLSYALHEYWKGHHWDTVDMSGSRGFVLTHDRSIEAAVSFAYDESGLATGIYIMRNPEKLANLGTVKIH